MTAPADHVPLFKIHCDLFEDQSECWPDDLIPLPHPVIDTMLDILVEQVRRKMSGQIPTELLAEIRKTMRIVPAKEDR